MRKVKIAIFTLILLFSLTDLWAFCGFYVAKTDASLFNNTSQVIIARDGIQTTVTMSSDFKGEVKDFALVVPVPEVLSKKQVRTVKPSIFKKCDAYSAPRLVQYHDQRVCPQNYSGGGTITMNDAVTLESVMVSGRRSSAKLNRKQYKVKVEDEFEVDEYDIVILSAKESDGLERWLIDNGYKIPKGSKEVLQPYIASKMKFFVVKVNVDRMDKSPTGMLSPIQINYNSNNFMLPIRLGMANAEGDQDMLVYTFTREGRVETTNYKTEKAPSNRHVPLFVKGRFGEFYKDLFEKSWKREGRDAVWLEYSWDISAQNPVKCDPCNSALFTYQELKDAGVWWLAPSRWGQYQGNLYMTRLHVRYNREKFPQDLAFQITPNNEHFQCRYILTNPSPGPFDCEAGQTYLTDLQERRYTEVYELAALTGWKPGQFENYVHEYDKHIKGGDGNGMNETGPWEPNRIDKSPEPDYMMGKVESDPERGWMILPLILAAILMVLGISRKRKKLF